MSFDFNLSSSDDDDIDRNNNKGDAGGEGNLFGEGLLDGNGNVSVGGNPKPAAMDAYNESDSADNNSADPNTNSENDFGFDDYYDFDEEEDRKPSSMDSTFATMAFPSDFDAETKDEVHDDEEEEDEIDWEDAQEETDTATLKAVTLDLRTNVGTKEPAKGNTTSKRKTKNQKRTRSVSVFKHDKLQGNPGLQSLLGDLHKSSLLAWASHAHWCSAQAYCETNLGLAHSLIPTAWLWNETATPTTAPTATNTTVSGYASAAGTNIPTEEDVGHFVHWFVSYVSASTSASGSSTNNTGSTIPRRGKRIRATRSSRSSKTKANNKRFDSSSLDTFSNHRLAEYCSHLSKVNQENYCDDSEPSNENHSTCSFNDNETLLLFLSMVRSLGWRARYVVALEPISRDLDVDHPLFHNHEHQGDSTILSKTINSNINSGIMASFFGNVLSWGQGRKETPIAIDDGYDDNKEEEDSKPPAEKIPPKNTPQQYPSSLYSNTYSNNTTSGNFIGTSFKHVCWAEILCKANITPNTKRRRSRATATASSTFKRKSPPFHVQWMYVDPVLGITNQPSIVEEAIFERDRKKHNAAASNSKGSKHNRSRANGGRNRRPIPYAIAAEHLCSHSEGKSVSNANTPKTAVRMTDVTRRYASSMVATLEARGIVPQKMSSKPKRRKEWRDMMMGNYPRAKEEEHPDKWFSRFLDTVSKREFSNRNRDRNRKKPPSPRSSIETRRALKSRGGSKEEAIDIALESSDESDLDRKPAAKNSEIETSPAADIGVDYEEESQLRESAQKEPLPTSKAAFKKHPLYAIRSVLNSTEVFKPNAKSHVCGMFKGELVFRRMDVETALSAKRWLYEGRKVRTAELKTPILTIKARKPPTQRGFKALKSYGIGISNDGSEDFRLQQIKEASEPITKEKTESLFGSWQTESWRPPPVGPSDPIPVNEHKNIELELLNPGLVHVELYKVAKVAKKLGLPYAPCLLGFEGSGRPTIRGIVVHETNEELLREAQAGMQDHLLQEENEKRERAILLRWKRLLVGVLTKDRLEREYGGSNNEDDDDKKEEEENKGDNS